MQVIEIIVSIIAIIGYALTSFFATCAFFSLRRLAKKVKELESVETVILIKTTSIEIIAQLQQINDMQEEVRSLVQSEEYEAAEQIKKLLEIHKARVENEIASFNRSFGNVVEMSLRTKNGKENKDDAT